MSNPTRHTIELLSPARNLACGLEAVNCGADAVYIGASDFGARQDAVNSLDDIKTLVDYAHLYGVKIYVTLNTILYQDELEKARQLALQLVHIGVDALITQDMAMLRMELPIPLHASTQMNNRTPEKAHFLSEAGFERIVLARELSLDEIRNIRKNCNAELEVFVHGALCVSYSGQCYASEYCFGRSANRGKCAQFCRLPFDLVDRKGTTLVQGKHLLSLKDMNRSRYLEELMDAGISSFKIEGRLKDVTYVKNITAYYRKQIDTILQRRAADYKRASYGSTHIDFEPQPDKSFNRGFTDYFLHGRNGNVASILTPKSRGEHVGEVKEIQNKIVKVAGVHTFHGGDGICYFDTQGRLQGFRVNKAESSILHLSELPKDLKPHTQLYRNHDITFERELQKTTPKRTLDLRLTLSDNSKGFILQLEDEAGRKASEVLACEKQNAQKPQRNRIVEELGKMGATPYRPLSINLDFSQEWFIPASQLSDLRRRAIEKLLREPVGRDAGPFPIPARPVIPPAFGHLDYTANVANEEARKFYLEHGAKEVDDAFEIAHPKDALVMVCKHCIKHTLGCCIRHGGKTSLPGPLYLRMQNGKLFSLNFNCHECQMEIHTCSWL